VWTGRDPIANQQTVCGTGDFRSALTASGRRASSTTCSSRAAGSDCWCWSIIGFPFFESSFCGIWRSGGALISDTPAGEGNAAADRRRSRRVGHASPSGCRHGQSSRRRALHPTTTLLGLRAGPDAGMGLYPGGQTRSRTPSKVVPWCRRPRWRRVLPPRLYRRAPVLESSPGPRRFDSARAARLGSARHPRQLGSAIVDATLVGNGRARGSLFCG
jgi:hypothetical protein